ncbi:MAG: hypothetical protein IJ760_06555 [Bacteroidales bacterium]|nr:hypothetical protein [Bacteroidales bacterium]
MKAKLTIIALMLAAGTAAMAQGGDFGRWFTGGTLRLDCLRRGSALGDSVWVERWIDRQADWHGSRTQLTDPFDNGDYRVVVRDPKSGRELYSRGYSNLFREYKDTPQGRTQSAVFEETMLLPMPRREVEIALQNRDADMRLHDQTVVRFRPGRQRLATMPAAPQAKAWEVHGDPATKLDVAFVMQGFDNVDDRDYEAACARMAGVLLGKEPFRSHRDDFNLYFLRADAGVDYNTFGADRYAMTFKLWQLHDALGTTPCDHVVVVLNNPVYGGGAIYNFYSVSSMHTMAEMVLPHELGHGIGGLADEYVDEDLSYADLHRTAFEPLEPNITNMVDFAAKWRHMLADDAVLPTPPDPRVPRDECGPLGAYEGAGYSSTGVYRPAMRCMMRDYAPFCPVCKERLEAVINLYTR